MNYKVILTNPALEDLDGVFNWIHEYSPMNALGWLEKVYGRISTLENFPERCPIAGETSLSKYTLRHLIIGKGVGKFRIIYRIVGETVLILHVHRCAQDIDRDL